MAAKNKSLYALIFCQLIMPRQDIPILSEGKPELHLTLEKEKSSPRIYWFTNRRYKKNIARLMKKSVPPHGLQRWWTWPPCHPGTREFAESWQWSWCWRWRWWRWWWLVKMMITMTTIALSHPIIFLFELLSKVFQIYLKNSCSQFCNVEWQDFLSLINLIPCFGNSLCLRGHIFCLLLCFFISNILSSSVLIWEITNWS